MSRFKHGESGNPRGRPLGSKNYITTAFKEQILAGISVESILADIEQCQPAQRAALKIKLLEFVQPKLKSIEFVEVTPLHELLQMSTAERRMRIMELKQQRDEQRNGA